MKEVQPHTVRMSVRTKVLIPMVSTMALLLGLTVWTVNDRVTRQFQAQARRSLTTAEAVFQHSLRLHEKDLLLRYRNLPNEPRYKAVFQTGDGPTIKALLNELLGEQGVDVIEFTTERAELAACAKRDPLLSTSDLETNSLAAISHALAGEEKVDTIRVGNRLFDIVSLPVLGTSGTLLGALTFGSEIGDAALQEFSALTRSPIVLLAGSQVLASSVPGPELRGQLARVFSPESEPVSVGNLREVLLDGEHYYCAAGSFSSLTSNGNLGYLLLISFEQPLRALLGIRQMLLWVSGLGILAGTALVWVLVRHATRPLRALRDSAEAVGRGDFSRRVEVTARDECGELAAVFNRMTENLQRSREQLEQTVETLKTTQAQLVQSEKLSGIGEFVAGVAHELNNPLTTVMGFSELLARAEATAPEHRRFLEMIHKSALRCQKIVQSLLSFARRHPPERKLSNLNTLVEAAVEFLAYQLRTSNIEVATRLDPHLPQILVDPHQLQQVFLNIVNNARQAIEGHRPKGQIVISTTLSGDRIRVVFEDNGPGIAEENLSKLFNPFFTTKEVGKGTGLGLSLCYGIIKEHGGTITVRSQVGQGATFIIELPCTSASEPPAQTASAPPSEPAIGREGVGKRVLVIDDEEPILEMIRETLAQSGYQVDTARDGQAALHRLGQTSYDLALCDWKMPGLNGQQIYERIRRSNPTLAQRMVFMTGDVINDRVEKFLQAEKRICLSKPFSLADFRSALDKGLLAS